MLKRSAAVLERGGISEPRREAASLLAFTLKKDRTFLIAHSEYELNADEKNLFNSFLKRRVSREPLQYITGRQEFYGSDFIVTPAVLIPRPETEIIVENSIDILENVENPRFCEVGIGSGCIAVSILQAIADSSAIGLDISTDALEIAAQNAANYKVGERLQLKISDVFSNLATSEIFDLIVSNPPYISQSDFAGLQPEVGNFEPSDALTDGADGLRIIEKIITNAPRFLKNGGWLLIEIGFDQSENVCEMFESSIWNSIEFLPDLQNIPRAVKVRLR